MYVFPLLATMGAFEHTVNSQCSLENRKMHGAEGNPTNTSTGTDKETDSVGFGENCERTVSVVC